MVVAIMLAAMMSLPVQAYEITQDTHDQIEEEVYYGELNLLACLVYAEAGGEDLYGKRLVVDAVLNRVDDPRFPDTITDVIYQKYQFSPVLDGGLERAFWNVSDDCFKAVSMEIAQRTNSEVLWFTAGGYGQYGTPLFKYGGHCFSK